jgi:hypothetical protein
MFPEGDIKIFKHFCTMFLSLSTSTMKILHSLKSFNFLSIYFQSTYLDMSYYL